MHAAAPEAVPVTHNRVPPNPVSRELALDHTSDIVVPAASMGGVHPLFVLLGVDGSVPGADDPQ
jgi:hypothetical protein